MAVGYGCFFWRLVGIDLPVWPFASEGVTVDWTITLALIVAVLLLGYLTAALLVPEKFA